MCNELENGNISCVSEMEKGKGNTASKQTMLFGIIYLHKNSLRAFLIVTKVMAFKADCQSHAVNTIVQFNNTNP